MRLYISSVVSVLLLLGSPFIMTEVVDSFSKCSQFFLNGEPPVIPGILEDSVSKNSSYVLICQKYKNDYRFATLYDTANRIPVFSAYKFTGFKSGRPGIPWMIEPQLEPSGADMTVPFVKQASNRDYTDIAYTKLNRGHLFPNCHAADNHTAESTFTLTNAVPQNEKFNSGSWSDMEQSVKKFMNEYCRDSKDNNKILAYVLTGAVPGNSTLKERVNIPFYMWTVFCCYHKTKKSFKSNAHWAKNEDDKVSVQSTSQSKNGKVEIKEINLFDLQENLMRPRQNITLFKSCKDFVSLTKDEPDKQTKTDPAEDSCKK